MFALTLVSYLEDLEKRLTAAANSAGSPAEQLVAVVEAFVDFGVEHPAFVDCAQTLMRRPVRSCSRRSARARCSVSGRASRPA